MKEFEIKIKIKTKKHLGVNQLRKKKQRKRGKKGKKGSKKAKKDFLKKA